MKNSSCSPAARTGLLLAALLGLALVCPAQNPDATGLTLLQSVTTSLNGSGIRVAQPEGNYDLGTNWEVNPGVTGRLPGIFTFTSANGSTTNFPNSLSSESGHADLVAQIFYGVPSGMATNAAHVDNYNADYFFNSIIAAPVPPNINDRVVNQSFIFGNVSTNLPTPTNYLSVSDQQQIDSNYDDYAAQFKTLFVSGAGNSGPVCPAATAYNGIGVAAYGGTSSFGPTLDNGRAKPDITAPAGATSFSTPQVAGAAAILLQAGGRGDGGGDTNSAADIRTVKALLLNGAIKPADWTNNAPSPLDTRYGAGVLNVFNSYMQLAGGKHGYIVSTPVSAGGAHPPTGATGTVGFLSGWDFNTNTSSSFPSAQDGVKHYYFNVTNAAGSPAFTATATLVWNRQQNQSSINNLDLYLYNAASSNLVAWSTSRVDNVEHVWLPQLPAGRYDLQVLMNASGINPVSNAEAYALAWEFFSTSLGVAKSPANVSVSWPVYPAGFTLLSATNLASPALWSTNNPAPVVTNNQNVVVLNATNAAQFFRLRRP
jgi:hypothetical protein